MQPEGPDEPGATSRRTFLTGAGATALAGLAAACSSDEPGSDASTPDENVAAVAERPTPPSAATPTPPPLEFTGPHQSGVIAPPAPAGVVAAFDVLTASKADLADTLQQLSVELRRLMAGESAMPDDDFLPPIDSGAIGGESSTAGLSATIAVGPSLFDDRFGLADRRPAELIPMPRFFNDRLVRDDLTGGDISITIAAPTQQAAVFALHQAVRVTDKRLQLRWVQEGYNELLPPGPEQVAPTRNLMGFRDGTSNLDPNDADVMNEHVWIQPGDNEPDWAVGGTYQAVRLIRMLIEFWATAALVRQEQIFGRHRASGAPLGQITEGELPAFAQNSSDEAVPRRSHMRLANPRTPGTGRILRRGFSYLNGVDQAGALDQGLLFIAHQRTLSRGFLEVQSRLDGEPLEDYIKPVGGGFFFVLPGPGLTEDGWLGQSLLA